MAPCYSQDKAHRGPNCRNKASVRLLVSFLAFFDYTPYLPDYYYYTPDNILAVENQCAKFPIEFFPINKVGNLNGYNILPFSQVLINLFSFQLKMKSCSFLFS